MKSTYFHTPLSTNIPALHVLVSLSTSTVDPFYFLSNINWPFIIDLVTFKFTRQALLPKELTGIRYTGLNRVPPKLIAG